MELSRSEFYTWALPRSPFRVHLSFSVVSRMQQFLLPGAGDHWPIKNRGLLLGDIYAPAAIVVRDFESIPADHPREIGAVVADVRRTRGQDSVIGFYCVRDEDPVQIQQDDLSFANVVFPDSRAVFLLIQRVKPDRIPTASFFVWERGHLHGNFEMLRFPFDASSLASKKPLDAKPAVALAVILAAVILGIAGVTAVRFLGARMPRAKTLPTSSPSRPSIGLQAVIEGGNIRLIWDHYATAIANAVSGRLSIADGDSVKEISLDEQVLRSGSVLYPAVSSHVQARLTVLGPKGSTSESVIVILARNTTKEEPIETGMNRAISRGVRKGSRSAVKLQSKSGPRPFALPQITPSIGTPMVAEPPPLPGSAEHVVTVANSLVIMPPPAPPEEVAASPAPTSAYDPPVPLNQAAPTLTPELKSLVSREVTVQVKLTIDAAGNVVRADPVPQQGLHDMLAAQAADAARLWKFRPARTRGVAVSSQTLVQFKFRPPR